MGRELVRDVVMILACSLLTAGVFAGMWLWPRRPPRDAWCERCRRRPHEGREWLTGECLCDRCLEREMALREAERW